MRTALGRFVHLKRLVAAALAVALILLSARLLAPDLSPSASRETDPSIRPAQMLKTPPVPGEDLKVGPAIGKLAPDFELSAPDGKRVSLSSLRGRPVVIDFWARWCTSCLAEMPALAKEQQSRGQQAFDVFAVNAGETRSQALEFIDFLKAPFVFGLDGTLTVSDAYGVYGLPMSVFIDSRGIVRAVYSGLTDQTRLTAFLDAAIAASPAPDLPTVLRPVSTIPRDHVITVRADGPDRLRFESRALRCDSSYCAGPTVDSFKTQFAGIISADLEGDKPDASLAVRFEPQTISAEQVTNALVLSLQGLKDPVYDTPLTVRTLPN